MTQLYKINVNLTPNQKRNIASAFHKRETIVLRLTNDALSGSDTLRVPANVVKRLEKSRRMNRGMNIKLPKTNIRKQDGGSLLSTVLSLGMKALPSIAKTIGLAGLSAGVDTGLVKKLLGRGGVQTGRLLIKPEMVNKLIQFLDPLSPKQKSGLNRAIQTAQDLIIKPTQKQLGSGLGSILASIGIPLAINLFKGLTGKGAPRMGAPRNGRGHQLYPIPPPIVGSWDQMHGSCKKKTGHGLIIGKNSPFKSIPILGAIL